MFLKDLLLVNFKNYKEAEFDFVNGINCFVGKNGTGKSNALDAIHYLSMCKSYISSSDKQNIHFGNHFFVIQGTFDSDGEEDEVYCGVKLGVKKVFKKNKSEYEKLADHIGTFPCVIISPYDRDLISDGGTARRRWMDAILCQVDKTYIDAVIKYNKLLAQRNSLLKQQADIGMFNVEALEVWDDQLASFGTIIYERRKQFLYEFTPIFNDYYYQIGENRENIGLEYRSNLNEMSFSDLLLTNRRKDMVTQYTNAGIHRDDILMKLNEDLVRRIGSQGQQKTFLIALKLAEFKWLNQQMNIKPLFLLDDIFDKLDNTRVAKLIQLISNDFFGQVFISDTDKLRLERIFENTQIPINFIETNDI